MKVVRDEFQEQLGRYLSGLLEDEDLDAFLRLVEDPDHPERVERLQRAVLIDALVEKALSQPPGQGVAADALGHEHASRDDRTTRPEGKPGLKTVEILRLSAGARIRRLIRRTGRRLSRVLLQGSRTTLIPWGVAALLLLGVGGSLWFSALEQAGTVPHDDPSFSRLKGGGDEGTSAWRLDLYFAIRFADGSEMPRGQPGSRLPEDAILFPGVLCSVDCAAQLFRVDAGGVLTPIELPEHGTAPMYVPAGVPTIPGGLRLQGRLGPQRIVVVAWPWNNPPPDNVKGLAVSDRNERKLPLLVERAELEIVVVPASQDGAGRHGMGGEADDPARRGEPPGPREAP